MLDDEAHVAASVDDEEDIKPFDGMEDIVNHLEELIGEAVHDLIQLYFHIFDFNNKTYYFMIPPLSPYHLITIWKSKTPNALMKIIVINFSHHIYIYHISQHTADNH